MVLNAVRMERIERLAYWVFVALSLSTVDAIAMTRPSVSEEQRTCARYLTLFHNLDFLKSEGYERVRRAAEAGNKDTVAAFFALVHGQMLAEQSHWLSFQGHFESRDHLLAWPSARARSGHQGSSRCILRRRAEAVNCVCAVTAGRWHELPSPSNGSPASRARMRCRWLDRG